MKFFKSRFISTLVRVKKRFGCFCPAQNSVNVRPNDTFLVSYPKSGNTYLRFLIGTLVANRSLDFYSIDKFVPDIYQVTSKQILRLSSPRLLKSHELSNSYYKKLIYLVRDPRDVAVSFVFWNNRNIEAERILLNMNDKLVEWSNMKNGFWSWSDHVGGWMKAHMDINSSQEILWIRYEDLVRDTFSEMLKISNFLKIERNDGNIRNAIKICDKKTMRDSELASRPYFSRRLNSFVRESGNYSFRNIANSNTIDVFSDKFGCLMEKCGYTF